MLTRRRPAVAGRFVLLEEVGRGATGVVHRARDLRRRCDVAVKVFRPALEEPLDARPAALLRFVAEQEHRIVHPHVLAPSGWAAEDDLVLIVMELARGGSVRDLLAARGTLPEVETRLLLAQLLQALSAVHALGVVHGDVKPANLLLRGADGAPHHLLLADFGAATRVDRLAPTPVGNPGLSPRGAGPIGTPAFLSPEAVTGAPPAPSRDIYAAGVLTRRALADPGPLTTLCDSMTRPEPELRPTADEALRRLQELPLAAHRPDRRPDRQPDDWPDQRPDQRAGTRSWVPTTRSSASASAAGVPGTAE